MEQILSRLFGDLNRLVSPSGKRWKPCKIKLTASLAIFEEFGRLGGFRGVRDTFVTSGRLFLVVIPCVPRLVLGAGSTDCSPRHAPY